jgi:SAM-dependent methyltransferase
LILTRVGRLLVASALAMFLAIWAATWLQANDYPVSLRPIVDGYAGRRTFFYAALFTAVLVMPVPFMTGGIFPLLLRLRTAGGGDLRETTGVLYLVNSLGAFSGAMLGKFVGFPYLGTQGFITLLYGLSCAAGLWALARISRIRTGRVAFNTTLRTGGLLAVCVAVAILMPAGAWRTYITGGPQPNWEVREGVTGVAQIWWEQSFGDVRVNGQYMSRLPDHPRHIKQSVFLLSQPRRDQVLVLGIGGAGIIRSLVEDPQVRHIDVVDWSYELPDLLSHGRAAEVLNNTLNSRKVRVIRTDARVAVGLFPKDSFDLVFDNLAFASWAGSTSINSERYFQKISNILKPNGVFVKAANYGGDNRLAVLAGLVRTFNLVEEHEQAEVVVSSRRRPVYSDSRIPEVLEPRAAAFDRDVPLVDWYRGGFATITAADLHGAHPIRDDLLIHEYYWNPLRF